MERGAHAWDTGRRHLPGLSADDLVVVTGAGGFIGGHMVRGLVWSGVRVRAVDSKPVDDWFQVSADAENLRIDLSDPRGCDRAVAGARWVYNLAADMGGMGFIEANKALCMLSVLINTNLLLSSTKHEVQRYFYASSACVYAADKQTSSDVSPLREEDAYPAMPEDGYGWEKLFSERMCRHFAEDFGFPTRIARYHNVYGPYGTFEGGREKAPAAICRKVAHAKLSGDDTIEIWGDGEQTRTFMYVTDCLRGTALIMQSDVGEPLNLGSDQLVTVNQLVDIVEEIAGVKLARRYKPDAPQGVRGRSSDNTALRRAVGWAPSTTLESGLVETYRWIHDEMAARYDSPSRLRGVRTPSAVPS